MHHNVYQTKISDKRVKLQHFLRYIVSSKINKLQFEIIFCSACHLVTTYSSWQKSFDKCLKQYKKTSNWQPLSSLLVIFSAATFGSKSVGSSSSTFVPMGYWDLSSFEAGIKKPKLFSNKIFHFGFLTPASKLLRSQQPMGTKVEEEDPIDLLPKFGAEKSTRRLLRGCQLEVF